MTLKEIFDEVHKVDSGLAHFMLHEMIHRYGIQDPRVKEIFTKEVESGKN